MSQSPPQRQEQSDRAVTLRQQIGNIPLYADLHNLQRFPITEMLVGNTLPKKCIDEIIEAIQTQAEAIEGPEREHTSYRCKLAEEKGVERHCHCGATEYNQARAGRLAKWKEVMK